MDSKRPKKASQKKQVEAALAYAESLRAIAAEQSERLLDLERERIAAQPKQVRKATARRKALEFFRDITVAREKPETICFVDGGRSDGAPWSGVLEVPMSPDDALDVIVKRFGSASREAARKWLERERASLPEDHALRALRIPAGWSD